MSASIVYVSSAPAKRSEGDFTPFTTGTASTFSQTSAYTSSISLAQLVASSLVAWAVWPSCHRNSADLRNGLVRSSHRTTLAHWFSFKGNSRYVLIHFPNMCQMTVSEVGRTTRGSSSLAAGSAISPPLAESGSLVSLWCVTTAHSFANPSTCSASFDKKLRGMNKGKYAFCAPVALILSSSSHRSESHTAMPHGLITMHPRTGLWSTRSEAYTTSWYHLE
mmetsp:Transcript_45647/g.92134  ORF Transcript_45647/g.92134 Transcript_45647/m.92134 type:complete len:221 (-) Transcript_45647:515-1177(-)